MDKHDDTRNRPGVTEPVDVVQVRADDALIAALSAADGVHVDDPIDERLASLLRSWRDDVQTEPDRPLVDLAAATAALQSGPRPVRRRPSPFGPLATAAAVLVIAFVGVGLAARDAEPGDTLWNVTKVLYTDKAKSVEAAVTVRAKLDQASKAIDSGNVTAAMMALNEAQQRLPVVAAEDGKQQLQNQTAKLMAELAPNPVTAAPDAPMTAPTSSTDPATSPAASDSDTTRTS